MNEMENFLNGVRDLLGLSTSFSWFIDGLVATNAH